MIKKSYIDTPDGQVHYRYRTGEGTPIVCFHQTASSSAMFDEVMLRWRAGHPLYALDTPGFGGSFDPPGRPSMRDYSRYMLAALRALKLDRAHLFGHHTGACVAIEIAVADPARVASLSMIGPVTITREEAQAFKSVYPKDFAIKADGSHLKKMWEYVAEIGGGANLELHHREFVDTARAWNGHIQVYSGIWDQDFIDLYQKVKCPLQIMCSPNDVLWPIFPRARQLRPDAAVAELGGSNFQTDEVPDQVIAALSGFLDQR